MKVIALVFTGLISCSVFAAPAMKQSSAVYKCKDDRGRVVFQQVPCDESNVTASNAQAHALWRKMRVLSEEAKNVLALLSGDVESIKQCNRSIALYNDKVDALVQDVRRAGRQYPELVKAHVYLKDCGVCRTSAEANCRTADKYLDQVVSKLTEY